MNEGEVNNFDVAVTFKGDGMSAAIEDLSKTETGTAATDDLNVGVEANARTYDCRLKLSPAPRLDSPHNVPEVLTLS